MIVRELIAKLGLKTDKQSFDRAEKRMSDTKDLLQRIGGFVTVGLVAVGFRNVINLASDANETLNVLNAAFGKNEESVKQWASTFGKEAGRSQYQMRELAGQLGAILNPLMENNADAAAEMSTRLSSLAVDLGSFYNATDDEALIALRSAIVGEAEPMKRFGVVMLEANLAAFALEQGITKNIKTMSMAEKTQLRYNFLIGKTALAHGDAAKTSEGFANASKGLLGGLRDLATAVGLKLLPGVEFIVNSIKRGVAVFTEWAEKSNILEAALIVLGAIIAKVAISAAISWGPAILALGKWGLAIAAAVLVLDDFLTFLEGGDSVIGRFIDSIWGPGSASAAVEGLKQAWQDTQDFLSTVVFPFWFETFPKALINFVSFVKRDVNAAIGSIGDAFDAVVSDIKAAIEKIFGFFDSINDEIKFVFGVDIKKFFQNETKEIEKGLKSAKDFKKETKVSKLGLREGNLLEREFAKVKDKTEFEILGEGLRGTAIEGSIGDIFKKVETGMKISRIRAQQKRESVLRIDPTKPVEKKTTNITFNQKTEMNVSGSPVERLGRGIVEKVSRKTMDVNKAALRALTQVVE